MDLAKIVGDFAQQMRVSDWSFTLRRKDSIDSAYVVMDREQRHANIDYNGSLPDHKLMFYLAHEVVHVALSDMSYVACNGRSIDEMEYYSMLEERACNVVAAILSPGSADGDETP